LKPACVTTCTTQCLEFGEGQAMTEKKRKRHAEAVTTFENGSF
jgi:Fe-S-cluster-containing dehydrogenase component